MSLRESLLTPHLAHCGLSSTEPFVSKGLMRLPGDLEHHEHILPLQMRILLENIIHAETRVHELKQKVDRDPGSLYNRFPAQNSRLRLYRHRTETLAQDKLHTSNKSCRSHRASPSQLL